MRLIKCLLGCVLMTVACAQTAQAQSAPKPEPIPKEVVDWETVHRECVRGKQFVTPEDEGCIRGVVARMPAFDPARRELFGALYDPAKYLECRLKEKSWGSACGTFHTLQRRPAPEYWPYPEAKRPNLPAPDLDRHYRPGIDPKEYYEALCKNVAGEFIFRTVENVESVYQIRPRPWANDDALTDPYVLEDPYGYVDPEGRGEGAGMLIASNRYRHVIAPAIAYFGSWARTWSGYEYSRARAEPQMPFVQFSRKSDKDMYVGRVEVNAVDSQYGYLWRDITGVRERDLGIAGGDLIAIELKTGEVFGYLRGFTRSLVTQRTLGGRNWRSAGACPLLESDRGRFSKDVDMAYWFLRKVLKPSNPGGK